MDPYDILGVPPSATGAEIKAAHRRLSRELHPDSNAGNEEKARRFRAVQQSYDLVGNPVKRAAYDQQSSKKAGPNVDPDVEAAARRFTSKMSKVIEDEAEGLGVAVVRGLFRWGKKKLVGKGP